MKRTSIRLLGRVCFVSLAVFSQVVWIVLAVIILGSRYPFFSVIIEILSLAAVLWLVSKDMNPAYKLAWTILILAVPAAGAVIYYLFGRPRLGSEIQNKLDHANDEAVFHLKEEQAARLELTEESESAACQSRYIRDHTGYPVYKKTETHYFETGEALYQALLHELKRAEHFIFMEYFIIDDGEMWQGILNILEQKASDGVDVRLIYDGWGCACTMPRELQKQLLESGIRCEVFNPLVPIASVLLNNRDHRKITVIDGKLAFTGGINLADEYINRKERFGYWKDTGILLKGEAVWSFTVMFLEMWYILSGEQEQYELYKADNSMKMEIEDDGFVQPYADTPFDRETVGENVYLNMINRAKRYVYIFTPYLITDNEMMTALCLAAKSGIDVRIVTPGIPDKKLVFLLTQSYYDRLLAAGVRVFEYNPGFLHAKSFVCDDRIAAVGTINMDYRSLYLHFECGVWMYQTKAVKQIRDDAMLIFRECREIKKEDCRQKSCRKRIWQSILRLFAPLL